MLMMFFYESCALFDIRTFHLKYLALPQTLGSSLEFNIYFSFELFLHVTVQQLYVVQVEESLSEIAYYDVWQVATSRHI